MKYCLMVLGLLVFSCTQKYELSNRALDMMAYKPNQKFKLRLNGKDTLEYFVTERKITKEIGSASSSLVGSTRTKYEMGYTTFTNNNNVSSLNIRGEQYSAPEFLELNIKNEKGSGYVTTSFETVKFKEGSTYFLDGRMYNNLLEYYDTSSSVYARKVELFISKDLGIVYYRDSIFQYDSLLNVVTLEHIP
jgi:hypothetical protein